LGPETSHESVALTDAPHPTTRRARWGLLAVTVVMGLAVTGIATWQYREAHEAASSVAEARGMDLFRAVRLHFREAMNDGSVSTPQLEADGSRLEGAAEVAREILAELEDEGLRYLALVNPRGEPLVEAGERHETPIFRFKPDADQLPREPKMTALGDRLRLDALVGRPPRRGPPEPRGPRGMRLLIEVEPLLATRIEFSASAQLIASAVVSLGLIALALLFWWMAKRAEAFEAAAARDRRLAALGEMSAVLGHELRNPLASLKGHLQLALEKTAPGERSLKNLERSLSESVRLERLMNEILDFARHGTLDIGDHLAAEVLDGAITRVPDPRIARSADANVPVSVDRPRMEQVLVNVLTNACEATPADGRIEAVCRKDGEMVVFEVTDSGPGFEPDPNHGDGSFDYVFLPFRTTRVKGTGLGLAIAKRIVEAHGGTISASNVEGGARVTIRLPGGAHGEGAHRG
jgi:two-component system sensor histidine kinase HydH